MFIDKIKIQVKAGNGGDGAVSFRREKYVARGGPDGGDGGRGGNVIVKIDEGANTLLAFRYKRKFAAESGGNGSGGKRHGQNGADVFVYVPLGTIIRDAETGKIIKDMSDHEPFILCRGGRGGWGNRHFATPTRQIPRFAKRGTEGEAREVELELKMLADVGLIGLPSVGKSSMLAAVSAAQPKIADYPFTTLSPNLGVVQTGGDSGFVMADIPGLIEGAAEGAGLGHAFLRHVDRCRLLVHVVDISCFEGRNPIDDIKKINAELVKYSPALATRPQMIVANKCDALDRDVVDIPAFEAFVAENGWDLLYASAYTGENMDELVAAIAAKLRDLPPLTVYEADFTPEDAAVAKKRETTITRDGDVFVVEGEWLFNLLGQVNLADRESLSFFQRVLNKSGVIDMLEQAGVHDGDTVRIYDLEFDFIW